MFEYFIVINPEDRFCRISALIMVDYIFELVRKRMLCNNSVECIN